MDKGTQTLMVCIPAVFAYLYLFSWTQRLLKKINDDVNGQNVTFAEYTVWYKTNHGFPFLLITLICPVVLGFIAGPHAMQTGVWNASAATLLALLESILVTLITLEFAYWSSANAPRCIPLIKAALFVDLLVLICLMRFVDSAPDSTQSDTVLEIPALFFVGLTALVASFRCIYAAAIYDNFMFSKSQPKTSGSLPPGSGIHSPT